MKTSELPKGTFQYQTSEEEGGEGRSSFLSKGTLHYNVPTALTAKQVEQKAKQREQEEVSEPDILERFGLSVEKRVQDTQKASEMYDAGEISFPEFAYEGAGNVAGIFLDAVGEGVMTALSEVTPSNWKETLQETIAAGGSALMDTETAQNALAVYNAIPERGRMAIESTFNVGGLIIPGTKIAGKTVPSVSKKTGEFLVESANKSAKKQLGEKVLGQGRSAKEKRAGEIGLPEDQQYTLNFEDRVLDTVLSLKGIDGGSSLPKIMGAVNRESLRLTNKVNKTLSRVEDSIPASVVNEKITRGWAKFSKENPLFNEASMQPKVKKIFQEAYKVALEDYDGTALGLVNLRRNFDKNIERLFSKDLHAGDDAHREVVAMVRNELNDMVESLVPDESVKALLQRQHKLLVAKSDLKTNIALSKSPVEKAVNYVSSHPFLVGGAVSGGGGLLAGVVNPAFAVPAATAALGVYGATRPAVRRLAGEAIQRTPVGRGLLYGAVPQEEE